MYMLPAIAQHVRLPWTVETVEEEVIEKLAESLPYITYPPSVLTLFYSVDPSAVSIGLPLLIDRQ